MKYDRELVGKTIKAIEKIRSIQKKREESYYKNRMRDAKLKEKEAMKIEVRDNIELLAPAAGSREKALVNVLVKSKEKAAVRNSGKTESMDMDT